MLPIAAIVVTHNSEGVIQACLDSLEHVQEAVVVDNASTDATMDYCLSRSVARLIVNQTNRGFAAAVNQGAAASTAPYLLICNPDIAVLDDLGPLIEAAARHGAAAGQLVDAQGVAQAGFTVRRFPGAAALVLEALGINRLWPSNPVNRRYRCLDRDLAESGPVQQPAGAFLLVRRDVFEAVGGFDDGFYPVWFEDVDFCRRILDCGYTIWYESGVRARHTGAHSVGRLDPESRARYWYAGLLRYAEKYLPRPGFTVVCAAVAAGAVPRMIAGILLERSGKPIATFRTVIRMALTSLLSGRTPTVTSVNAGNEGEREGRASLSHPAR